MQVGANESVLPTGCQPVISPSVIVYLRDDGRVGLTRTFVCPRTRCRVAQVIQVLPHEIHHPRVVSL